MRVLVILEVFVLRGWRKEERRIPGMAGSVHGNQIWWLLIITNQEINEE